MSESLLRLSDEVALAVRERRPVVALESTLISHGLPWPTNFETAVDSETAIRAAGAVPATIGVIDVVIRVGLASTELERLAKGQGVVKASPRDLPWVTERGQTAAMTVAGTIFLAHRAGIPLMATGGIGGVHRDFFATSDISADLLELTRTSLAVVCSGAKAILDIARTLEHLETIGVPVVGYGTDEFPAFLSRSSGFRLDSRVDSPDEAARLIQRSRLLDLSRSTLFVQPPPEHLSLDSGELEQSISTALEAARASRISGKAVTPFLLDQIRHHTQGRALAVNRALVVQNARLAATIACALLEGHR